MKSNCNLDCTWILKMAEAGSDTLLTVAAGTNWKTEIEGKKYIQDFTFKQISL